MENYYGYGGSPMMDEELLMVVAGIYGMILILAAIVGIVCYVLRCVAVQHIARRRGLSKPWLVWLPVGTEWIIGSISDQYRYVVKGEVKSKRKILLGLSLTNFLCGVTMLSFLVYLVVRMTVGGQDMSDSAMASIAMAAVLGLEGVGTVASIVGIVLLVFRSMAMYDLYHSCDPNNAVAYLVLGIVFGFLEPIFLMIIRKKDSGMPPRRDVFPERSEPDYPHYE